MRELSDIENVHRDRGGLTGIPNAFWFLSNRIHSTRNNKHRSPERKESPTRRPFNSSFRSSRCAQCGIFHRCRTASNNTNAESAPHQSSTNRHKSVEDFIHQSKRKQNERHENHDEDGPRATKRRGMHLKARRIRCDSGRSTRAGP